MRKIIAGLEVGSETLKLVVGESYKNRINILAVAQVPSQGVKKGFIIEPNLFLNPLKELFLKCENMLGLRVSKVVVTVPSEDVEFMMLEGKTTISKDNPVISQQDIIHSMQAATYNRIEKDKEIVSIKPTSYTVDNEKIDRNPIGMEGKKLVTKTLVVTIPKKNVLPIVKCLEKVGVETINYTLESIADYYQLERPMMKDVVGAIINIGYETTTISIFNKGLLTNTEVMHIGGKSIEKDIAYMFHLPKNAAKNVKMELAQAHSRGVSANIQKEYTTTEDKNVLISEYEATEVATSRLEEILKLAKKQINLLTKKEIHYIMITGGVSEMTGFPVLVESIFGHNAKVASPKELGVRSNIYSAAVGLIKYYDELTKLKKEEFSIFNEEETEELSNVNRKLSFGENSILGKLFGYFYN